MSSGYSLLNLMDTPLSQEQQKLLVRLEQEGLRFGNLLISLASGTIVLSITFLGNVATTGTSKGFLIACWVFLVLSVLFGLLDRLLYIWALSLHPVLAQPDEASTFEERWERYSGWAENAAKIQAATFFIGIVLLLVFAIENV